MKQSEIVTCQTITFENRNIVDIKSVIAEHLKTLHKLLEIIRQTEKVGSKSSLHNDTKEVNFF